MADKEDDGLSRTITVAEPPEPADVVCEQPVDDAPAAAPEQGCKSAEGSVVAAAAAVLQPEESAPAPAEAPGASEAQLADLFQSGPEEQSIVVGADFADLGNTTIIYVQPDGSLVEGSGLTAEEQQALLEQLSKQQIVQVSDTEAAQLLQQHSPLVKPAPVQNTALDPSQLQQVINQVAKSQQQVQQQVQVASVVAPKQPLQVPQQKVVQVPQQTLRASGQNNASLQLKSVAQQFTLQTGTSVQLLPKKVSGIGPEPAQGSASALWVEGAGPQFWRENHGQVGFCFLFVVVLPT